MPTALVTWQECQEGTSGSHLSPLSAAMGVISSMLVRSVDKLLRLPLQPQPSHPRHSVMLPKDASRDFYKELPELPPNCQSDICI